MRMIFAMPFSLVQDFINPLTLYIAPLTPTLSPRSGGLTFTHKSRG